MPSRKCVLQCNFWNYRLVNSGEGIAHEHVCFAHLPPNSHAPRTTPTTAKRSQSRRAYARAKSIPSGLFVFDTVFIEQRRRGRHSAARATIYMQMRLRLAYIKVCQHLASAPASSTWQVLKSKGAQNYANCYNCSRERRGGEFFRILQILRRNAISQFFLCCRLSKLTNLNRISKCYFDRFEINLLK